jgi:hypothetical protein
MWGRSVDPTASVAPTASTDPKVMAADVLFVLVSQGSRES